MSQSFAAIRGIGRMTVGEMRAEVRQGALGPTGARLLAIDRKVRPLERKPAGDWRRHGVTAFVTIMEGCDKKCAYCIVPTTRGQEVSRPVEEVLDEVQLMTGEEHGAATGGDVAEQP